MVNKQLLLFFLILSTTFMRGQDTLQSRQAATLIATDTISISENFTERNFEEGFQKKYDDPEFVYERKAASASQWDRFVEWLGKVLRNIFSFGEGANSAIGIIVKVIAALIILFVVYLIVRALINKEGMWIFGRSRKNIHVEDTVAENIHVMDFNKLVSETKGSCNYRLAVRYYYLWLLKKLSLREIIDWHWDKTNSDYLYEIKDNTLKKDFEYLSYLYDYSWYGEFPLDEAAFAKAEKAFQKTLNTL